MKKVIVLLFMLSIVLSGCGNKNKQNDVVTENTTASAQSSTVEKAQFKSGLWSAKKGDTPVGYYIMNADAKGRTLEYENGVGISFSYEIGTNEVTFHYGDVNNNTRYTMQNSTSTYVELLGDNGEKLVLTHINEATEISFTTNVELAKYACEYYRSIHGETPPSTGTMVNSDGTVTIQLYANVSGHNSTWAWYTVDRTTGEGTDALGTAIDIIP